MCAEKILLVLMGAERRVKRVQTWERGPPSAQVEFDYLIKQVKTLWDDIQKPDDDS